MPSLTRAEALQRARLLAVTAMEVDLDLDRGREHFGSRTTIRFTCTEPGASTFAELRPVELHAARLNGVALEPGTLADGRLPLSPLAADNVLEVDVTMAYSRDGQGLHRTTDPADGEDYVYGHLFLDAAPTVFACFDQPDLKAPYAVSVTAPSGWRVLGNGAETEIGEGRWELERTQPLATYVVTVCAGPWASVRDEHDGIPLGVHARRSLEPQLAAQAPQMLEVTRACLDACHALFGIRYPFGSYDQVFVPEFNAGAMENPGCVTFRDDFVHRGAASRSQVMTRSLTIAHEMAHMWFGDLVTMRWWDDLWLNESFAEYMAYRIATAATELTDAWVEFAVVRKAWGYAADRAPSTHPVAGSPAPDALSALGNFDGISYAKGASVLRQLIAHLGDEAFVAGVTAYLREHAFGNGELSELLAAMEAASGRDLDAWSRAWLQTAGADTLAVDRSGVVSRLVPERYPAERPHTTDIAGFSDGREDVRVPLVVDADRVDVPALVGCGAALLVPNAADLTWARVVLDPETLAALPGELARVPDPMARAVLWTALLQGVHTGDVDPRHALDVVTAAWPLESDESVLTRVAAHVVDKVIPWFLPPQAQASALARVAGAALTRLTAATPGGSDAIVAARVHARTCDDGDRLRGWLGGAGLPEGLVGDTELRWIVVTTLAARGLLDEAEIAAELAADDTIAGRLSALAARAGIPHADAKAWAWAELTSGRRSNHECLALASGLWRAPDRALVRPCVERFPDGIVGLAGHLGDDALARLTLTAYPIRVTEDATLAMSRSMLTRDDLTPGVRRSVVDMQAQLEEALASRERYG